MSGCRSYAITVYRLNELVRESRERFASVNTYPVVAVTLENGAIIMQSGGGDVYATYTIEAITA